MGAYEGPEAGQRLEVAGLGAALGRLAQVRVQEGALAGPALAYDDATESRIRTLVETGMQYYWSGGDVKKAEAEVFKGITLHGRYDVVEQAFAEASTLAPERLDFRYAVASTQIIQKKIPEAEATYQEITRRDPRAADAYAWLAALARAVARSRWKQA